MSSPTKRTETVRHNRDSKLARNRNKKIRREAPASNNQLVLAKLEERLKKSK